MSASEASRSNSAIGSPQPASETAPPPPHSPAPAAGGTIDTVWLTRLYLLFFIEVGSRHVHLAGCTCNPTSTGVVQQARNLVWKLQDGGTRVPPSKPSPRTCPI